MTYTEIMRGALYAIALTVLLTCVPTAAADDLEVSFSDGRVTVIASDVSLRTILQEWSRVGQTDFIDADSLTGQPVRLQLIDVREADALRVLLREATGYVAAPRATWTPDSSRFDRVLVMATSRRPAGSSYTQSPGSTAPSPVPAQRGLTFGAPGFDSEFAPQELGADELEELREILPQPFNLIDRSLQPDDQSFEEATAPTASRPGVVVAPDQPTEFIRRPVRPQAGDDPGR